VGKLTGCGGGQQNGDNDAGGGSVGGSRYGTGNKGYDRSDCNKLAEGGPKRGYGVLGGAGGAKTQVEIPIFPNEKDVYSNSNPVTYKLISYGCGGGRGDGGGGQALTRGDRRQDGFEWLCQHLPPLVGAGGLMKDFNTELAISPRDKQLPKHGLKQ
jgi:hypothetical protein